MSQGFMTSVDTAGIGIKEISIRDEDILRTQLSVLNSDTTGQNIVQITLKNIGQTKINNFERWDFIVQYTDTDLQSQIKWLPYVSSAPTDNQWTVEGIYVTAVNGKVEAFEPGILNPGEEIVLEAQMSPQISANTSIMVNIAAPNGISVSSIFTEG